MFNKGFKKFHIYLILGRGPRGRRGGAKVSLNWVPSDIFDHKSDQTYSGGRAEFSFKSSGMK